MKDERSLSSRFQSDESIESGWVKVHVLRGLLRLGRKPPNMFNFTIVGLRFVEDRRLPSGTSVADGTFIGWFFRCQRSSVMAWQGIDAELPTF